MRTNWAVTRHNYFLLLMTFLAGISCGSAPAPDKKRIFEHIKQRTKTEGFAPSEKHQRASGLLQQKRPGIDGRI